MGENSSGIIKESTTITDNGVCARGHVTLSTSIGKALDFRFLEKGSAMLCLWLPMDVDRVT